MIQLLKMEIFRLKTSMRQIIYNFQTSYDYNRNLSMMEIQPFKKLVILLNWFLNLFQFLKGGSKVNFLKFYRKYKMKVQLMRNLDQFKKKSIEAFNLGNQRQKKQKKINKKRRLI